MKDWLFYPLIMLIAGAMIFIAVSIGETEDIDPAQGITIRGDGFSRLVVGPGNHLKVIETQAGPVARLSSSATHKEAPSAGIFLAIPKTYQDYYDGIKLNFSLKVRKSDQNGNSYFQSGFFSPASSKPWQKFELTGEFEEYIFTHIAKKNVQGDDFFYFGIWPDPEGKNRNIDVLEISVKPETHKSD